MPLERFRVVIEFATEEGHPGSWNWPEILDECNVNLVDVVEIKKMGLNDPEDDEK